jgi:hypothetical protein
MTPEEAAAYERWLEAPEPEPIIWSSPRAVIDGEIVSPAWRAHARCVTRF